MRYITESRARRERLHWTEIDRDEEYSAAVDEQLRLAEVAELDEMAADDIAFAVGVGVALAGVLSVVICAALAMGGFGS